MEEIVKELREDKKRAWEMITSLNERLSRAEKMGKDDDLHSKMDRILEMLAKHADLEKKVNCLEESHGEIRETMAVLNDKMNNSVVEVTKSKEMLKVIDTVETTEGYVELFVKDFDKLHGKLNEIEGRIENTRQLEQKLDLVVAQVRKVQDIITANKEEIPKIIMEIRKETKCLKTVSELKEQGQEIANALEFQQLDIEEVKREMARKPKLVYKCFNLNCRTVLTKELVLNEDGVSVHCPNIECCAINIVENGKEGYKWMGMSCNGNLHYQQHPLDKKHRASAICLICGKDGKLYDASVSAIISIENTETDVKNSIGASYFVKKATKVKEDSEKINKCWNSNCNTVLPKNIAFEKDGVSVGCPNSTCRRYNIVGTLKEGNRWFWMSCNGNIHFQQFPFNTRHRENKKCQICGVDGEALYKNAFTAMRE